MSRVKSLVCAALIGMMPGIGLAQQTGQPAAPLPREGGVRVVPEDLTAPLPAVRPAEPGPIAQRQAPAAPGMMLAELEEMALGNNPTVNQAAARAEAARGQCVQVGLYPNPVAGYIGAEMGNSGRAGQQGGFVSQELVTAGKLQLSRSVAFQEVQQAEYAWEAQRQRVLTDVRRSFYEVLVAQRAVELTEQLLRISEEGVKSTEALMKAKEVARGDVLQARIEADSARVLLEKARNRHLAAWRTLAAVTVAVDMKPRLLAGDVQEGIPQLTWDETFSRLLEQSPQLAGAQVGVARARATLSRECAGRVPNVELQAAVQFDNATRDTFASVQLGIPIAIYNRNQGNIQKANAELIAAQEEVHRVQLELQQRLATVFEQYTNARYQVEKYSRDILPNAEASLKLTNSGYRQGEYSFLSLLMAQRTFFQTNLTYLEALRELRAAATAIEGNLLSDSLQTGEILERGVQQR